MTQRGHVSRSTAPAATTRRSMQQTVPHTSQLPLQLKLHCTFGLCSSPIAVLCLCQSLTHFVASQPHPAHSTPQHGRDNAADSSSGTLFVLTSSTIIVAVTGPFDSSLRWRVQRHDTRHLQAADVSQNTSNNNTSISSSVHHNSCSTSTVSVCTH